MSSCNNDGRIVNDGNCMCVRDCVLAKSVGDESRDETSTRMSVWVWERDGISPKRERMLASVSVMVCAMEMTNIAMDRVGERQDGRHDSEQMVGRSEKWTHDGKRSTKRVLVGSKPMDMEQWRKTNSQRVRLRD